MDPITIAYAATAAFQLASGFQQGEMIREQAALKQRVDQMNIDATELDAFHAEQFGQTEAARYQNVVDATLSGQRTAFAAQNVDASYGTAGELQAETKLTGFLNMLDIRRQATEKAAGLRSEARNMRLGSSMGRFQAEINAGSAQAQGVISAAQTGTGYLVHTNTKYYGGTNPRSPDQAEE